jgi:hypothetical protein
MSITCPSCRSAPTDDLVAFCLEKGGDSESWEYWILAARMVGPERVTLSSGARTDLQRQCDRLNEALFLMKAPPPMTTGPYR